MIVVKVDGGVGFTFTFAESGRPWAFDVDDVIERGSYIRLIIITKAAGSLANSVT